MDPGGNLVGVEVRGVDNQIVNTTSGTRRAWHTTAPTNLPLAEGSRIPRSGASVEPNDQVESRLAMITWPSSLGRVNCGQCPVGRSM
jgi:hypothetical protein